MEPEEEEQQKREGFMKKATRDFQKKKEKSEKTRKAIEIFMKLPTTIKVILLIIILVPLIILLLAAFRNAIDEILFDHIREITTDLFGSGTTSSDLVSLNKKTGTWDINLSDNLKKKLTDEGINVDGMSQDELMIQLLKLYGLDENDFSDKELELLPYLLKAELATQYVDLRKRDEMYDSSAQKYKILSDSEIEKTTKNNQIIGTIHFKRVNTSDLSNPILLEYIDYETFKQTMEKENPTQDDYNNIKGYFSINDEGNAVIATWNYNKVTYTLDDGYISNPYNGTSTFQNSENYILSEMTIDYKPLVNKYTLPFEVLTALLINSEDVNFVEEVANLAFSANIEITIAEEMTETNKTYITNYYETIRNYQYIRMLANENVVEEYKFLDGDSACDNANDVIEDEGLSGFSGVTPPADIHNCTYKDINFTNDKSSYTVKQNIEIKDNTYKYGITYADTWFIKATKDISQKTTTEDLQEQGSMIEDTYKYDKTEESKRAKIPTTIKKDYLEDYYGKNKQRVQENVEQQIAAQQESTLVPPIVSNVVNGMSQIKIEYHKQIKQIIDGNGINRSGETNIDNSTRLIVTTISGAAGDSLKIVDVDNNTFEYSKNDKGEWVYNSFTPDVTVDYEQKTIKYKRTDTQSSMQSGSTKTKYELIEGTPTQDLYDDKSEKFLKAYDESDKARGNVSSSQGWLEDMLNEYDPNFTTIIMYLIDTYYGRDTSEYDIQNVLDVYGLDEFRQFSGTSGAAAGFNQFKKWLRSKEGHTGLSSDGTKYKVGIVKKHRTVGYGIDLETSGKEEEIKALTGMTEIKEGDFIDVEIIDNIEDQCIKSAIETVEKNTNGLNLKEYQKYALVSRMYNCGADGAFRVRNGKNFRDAYTTYWKETDDEYGVTPNDGMYNHLLYTQYMKDPQTSEGEYVLGLENRRKSEWILFKTGYFDSLGEYYVEANRYSIEGINLYNTDGSVNESEIAKLNQELTTRVTTRSGKYMNNGLEYKQCTWWVYSRASEYLGKPYPKQSDGRVGNGGEWYDKNKKNGWFEYGSEPRANSIVCWWNKSSPQYGHVAYVEAVDTVNQKIYISHAGGGTSWKGITKQEWSGYFDGATPNGYIYLDSPKNFK